MARDLTANQQSRLEDNPYRSERLIEILTPATNYFYTTGDINVDVLTDTNGGTSTYLSNMPVEVITELTELYEPGLNEVGITISDISNSLYDNVIRLNNNYDYQKTELNIYLLFRNISTGVAYTSDVITLFRGNVYKVDTSRTASNLTINIRANNYFNNFLGVNGITTADFPQGLITDNIDWGA
jgi:hypothetical protein